VSSEGLPATYLRAETEAIEALDVRFCDEDTSPGIPAAVRLVCLVGPDMGKTFPVPIGGITIGRGETDVVLQTADVSRAHARIRIAEGVRVIEDLRSSNGTFVNGVEIQGPTELVLGDRIQIGSTILVYSRHDELEERLQQLQRLEAMGALVKGLGHDFNNVLTVLSAGLEELQARAGHDERARATIEDMMHATDSAASLVRRLLRVGRNKPGTSELVDFGALIADVIKMAKRVTPESVSMSCDVTPFAMARGSREELRNVFMNLLNNARDAMPGGGQISISASVVSLDRPTAHANHLPREGSYIEVFVRDTGHGMDDATLARVFEPFFTTKPRDKGTGLGLAMVFSSIRNHQGSITAESAVGRGTTFRILLPTAS
jgi:signal transduction histidine kinase